MHIRLIFKRIVPISIFMLVPILGASAAFAAERSDHAGDATGAAMLLIRPFLRMNRKHLRPYHAVFFIFIVANVGGSLTPVGDPPLFLGYLMGVPFWWVLEQMRVIWMVAVGCLLAVFFVIDT